MTPIANARFNAVVVLADAAGTHHTFTPGDPIPAWAFPLIGDHVVDTEPAIEFGTEPAIEFQAGSGTGVVELPAAAPEPGWPGEHTHGRDSRLLSPPPVSGPGSNRNAWLVFAEQVGVPVARTMSRRDIINALQRRGILPA